MAKRLVIAGTGSSAGKTTIMLGLLAVFAEDSPSAFKVGPDFIDPLFHRQVLGVPSTNLDGFFLDEAGLRQTFARHAGHLNLIEGVMGYYDGQALTGVAASTYDIARILQAPVILVVDLAGMGHSVCALINGFVNYRTDSGIKGVILNNCSAALYERLAPVISAHCPVQPVGYLPRLPELNISSRELGLTPQSADSMRRRIARLAEELNNSLDLATIRRWLDQAPAIAPAKQPPAVAQTVAIGLAQDDAFCFYYPDNLALLRDMGAELIEFSPLEDKTLPEVSAIYLGGGYQTDYAARLAANQAMRRAIRQADCPIWAEGGGYFYLCQSLQDSAGQAHEMVGLLPGHVKKTDRLGRFGYQTIIPPAGSILGKDPIKGHEFHYWDHDTPGTGYRVEKGGRSWQDGYVNPRLLAGYHYLYLPSQPQAARHFVQAARSYYETTRNRSPQF